MSQPQDKNEQPSLFSDSEFRIIIKIIAAIIFILIVINLDIIQAAFVLAGMVIFSLSHIAHILGNILNFLEKNKQS